MGSSHSRKKLSSLCYVPSLCRELLCERDHRPVRIGLGDFYQTQIGEGGEVSGQRSQVTGISGKSPLRRKWVWGSRKLPAVGLSSVWPFEISSCKTEGEPGRAVTGGPHPPARGERGRGRASRPKRWGTEACRWSRGQVVSEVAGAARVKWVCGAWPPALADFGISAPSETPSRSPASGSERWRGVLRVCASILLVFLARDLAQ